MKYLKYAIIIVPVVALIAMGALFGKLGVRPRALPVIKPSNFERAAEIGFWAARQSRQKIFRNNLIFFGLDPSFEGSREILESFLETSRKEGNAFDVVLSAKATTIPAILNIPILPETSPEDLTRLVNSFLQQNKRVVIVGDYPQSSKLFKKSLARKLQYENALNFSSFSVVKQNQQDLSNLREADFCSQSDRLSFESIEILRCLFLGHEKKFEKELLKNPQALSAAVDQFGLDDYLIYVFSKVR